MNVGRQDTHINDVEATVIKVAAKEVTKRTYALKGILETLTRDLDRLTQAETSPNVADLVRRIEIFNQDIKRRIAEISGASSLLHWKLKHVPWPRGERWRPDVSDKLDGQVVHRWASCNFEWVLIQKQDGGLVTLCLSSKSLREKFNTLKPVLGQRVMIERLPNLKRAHNYFVALIPWGTKVAI